MVQKFAKMAKFLYTHLHRKKWLQQSDVLKRFLAGTYSNQFLYLNSVSESEKTEDSKNHSFPKKGIIFLPEISL